MLLFGFGQFLCPKTVPHSAGSQEEVEFLSSEVYASNREEGMIEKTYICHLSWKMEEERVSDWLVGVAQMSQSLILYFSHVLVGIT